MPHFRTALFAILALACTPGGVTSEADAGQIPWWDRDSGGPRDATSSVDAGADPSDAAFASDALPDAGVDAGRGFPCALNPDPSFEGAGPCMAVPGRSGGVTSTRLECPFDVSDAWDGSSVMRVTWFSMDVPSTSVQLNGRPLGMAGETFSAVAWMRAANDEAVGIRSTLALRRRAADGSMLFPQATGTITLTRSWQRVTVVEVAEADGEQLDSFSYAGPMTTVGAAIEIDGWQIIGGEIVPACE